MRKIGKEIVVVALITVVVSIICNKILAVHTFKVIDGYVKDMLDMAMELIRDTYADK